MTENKAIFNLNDITQAQADTPGLPGRIHLDNCGSALMPGVVARAIQTHLELELRVGGYVAQEQQSEALASVYCSFSRLLGGKNTDYALAGSAVDAWTKAFYSIPMAPGDNIVTAYNEYCSNYVAYLQRAKREGIEIRVANPDANGKLDLNHLESLIDGHTKLISLTHVPSSSGQIAPVEEVGKIARAHNILFLLDACQSIGQMPVNLPKIGCDMATGTSRKFLRGPRGIGFLYINEKARAAVDPVVLTNQAATWTGTNSYSLREDAGIFEAWERSCANQLGLGAALDYFMELGVEKTTAQVFYLANYLRKGLASIAGVTPTCQADSQAAIITFNKKGWNAADIKAHMDNLGIATQVASVVHTRLDLEARGIETIARISPHYYNTVAELDQFLNALEVL